MRAAVLGDARAGGQQCRRRDPVHRVPRLGDQGCGLRAPGFLGDGGIGEQLGKTTGGAQPHLQRVNRIRSRFVIFREVIARGLLAEIENDSTVAAAAGAALVDVHPGLRLARVQNSQLASISITGVFSEQDKYSD